ncbi:MAG: outer membrane protein assembly factor BamE [Phycisphaeraceae bacterium]|nr:outer membrane protein assembly factor BamE [Phycisphaeraceae bacterium]
MNRTVRRFTLTLGMLAAGLCTSGCLITGSNHQTVAGSYVGVETMEQIRPGQTTAEWVEATLGMPTSRQTLTDGAEIWRYSYTRTKSGHGAVLLLFSHRDSNTQTHSTIIEFRDGVVQRAWQD